MKREQFYIMKWADEEQTEQTFELVNGYSETVNARCFGVDYSLDVGFNRNEYGDWNATHLKSGLALCNGKRTRKDALAFVNENLFRIADMEKRNKRCIASMKSLERYKRDGVCEQIPPFVEQFNSWVCVGAVEEREG